MCADQANPNLEPPTAILHVDMDAFFVAAEILRQPELAGHPVVVGGIGPRGVVATASYEARSYGLHSGMPNLRARKLCPQATFLAGDHDYYRKIWKRVMEVLESFTPLVEATSCDEAFLDIAGSRLRFGEPLEIAHRIRAEVYAEAGLRCSIGVASNKLLAKLASRLAKPHPRPNGPETGRGVVLVPPSEEVDFLHPLPVKSLWGVGAATLQKLDGAGISTVGDLYEVQLERLIGLLGSAHGRHLHDLARGVDESPVVPTRPPKSMSSEVTFARDAVSVSDLRREILRQSEKLARRLRKAGYAARVVTLKLRHPDFRTATRSLTLSLPTSHGAHLAKAANRLLAEYLDREKASFSGFRLLGVGASSLSFKAPLQLSLEGGELDAEALDSTLDGLRSRFGDEVVIPAALLGCSSLRPIPQPALPQPQRA